MKLSEVHQELIDEAYPNGYNVDDAEKESIHVMFVDIVGGGKGRIGKRVPIFQKYFPAEWIAMAKTIEKLGIVITGHNEYTIVHDPTEVKSKAKPEPKSSQPNPK